ncbi:MAG: sigma-54-dependent Fis family transcriptional regulator, partial [Myxococcales bacterium]|nr:sigma-54-dependent Fis family transcriptional regulator [Myxococcales bacterium]
GHRKGSFTGALEHRQGLFQAAHQGTLFLDEIGEMPLAMQAKVLRALQEQKVMAVGSLEEEEVNLRIVAATNRPLLEDVNAGRFREDLYYRLNVIPIHLPPLRERPSDIALLTEHFIAYYAKEYSKVVKQVNPMVMEALTKSIFPGNVRELKNLVERAVTLATCEELSAKDFLWESTANFVMKSSSLVENNAEQFTRGVSSETSTESLSKNRDGISSRISIEMTENLSALALLIQEQDDEKESQQSKDAWDIEVCLEKIETGLIKEALDRCSGNRTETAKYLGLSFRSLRYRLKKLGIDD